MGNIGKCVAQIFHRAFEADIIAYGPYLPVDAWADIPHQHAPSIEVLSASEVVAVQMPLTPNTRNLIGYPQFKIIKKTTIVINTAGGEIINESKLEQALSEGLIWVAGLDCHEQEPPGQEKYGGL